MVPYLQLLSRVLESGVRRRSRPVLKSTGASPDTLSVFGAQARFDLREGFPAVTTKKLAFNAVVHELVWFLAGSRNIAYLQDHDVHIWDSWANHYGDVGPVYGRMWRSWPGKRVGETVDQIRGVVEAIKTDPTSRRLVVSAWNVALLDEMALPPCHAMFQFYVHDGRLSCHLYQRSGDVFLGVPFNIASYALLTHMIAHVTDLCVGELIISFGDLHLYENHVDQAREQLSREPRPLPRLAFDRVVPSIDDFTFDDVRLVGYEPYPAIKGEVAV